MTHSADLGATAHLSEREQREVLTLLSMRSPRLVQASDSSGLMVPAHGTSPGRALPVDVTTPERAGEGAGLRRAVLIVRDFRARIVAALKAVTAGFRFADRLEGAGAEVRARGREPAAWAWPIGRTAFG